MTMDSGPNMTGCPLVMLIAGIICMTPMTRKYTLANLENYSNRFMGTKVSTVYLDVLIELSGTCSSGRLDTIILSEYVKWMQYHS